MINEEITSKAINLEIRIAKILTSLLIKEMKQVLEGVNKLGGFDKLKKQAKLNGKEVKLKEMVKKGQLEEIPVNDQELKELKKEMNRMGVNFSIMKNKEENNYSVFFQAKDTKVMEKAFKNAISKAEQKVEKKESVRESINKMKEQVKDTITKDKVKNKHQEQSL